jgi:hypothetical protein
MSPAELKARLQANLAVAGVKSSDPGPIAAAASGEKPQVASEALGSAPVLLEKFSAPAEQAKAHRLSTEEQKAPEGHQNPLFGTQTETQISTVMNSISETRGNQANRGASNRETSNPETPNAEPSNLGHAVPGNLLVDLDANSTNPEGRQSPTAISSSPIAPAASGLGTSFEASGLGTSFEASGLGTSFEASGLGTSREESRLRTGREESVLASPSALDTRNTEAPPALTTPAKTLDPHRETSVVDSASQANNERTTERTTERTGEAKTPTVQNPRPPAATASLQQQQNVGSFSLGQSTEEKRSVMLPAPDRDLGSLVDSQRQNETANLAARTGEPRTELAPTVTSAPAVASARKRAQATPPTVAKRADRTVLHRRDQGAVLRGYRIPVELHRQAERAKLGLASRRGSSLFWDELLQGAIDLLLDDIHRISNELSAARRTPEMGTPNTRVLQAAIRHDQDLRLRMLRIDLEELDGATVRLEEIWTWLIRQVVKNEG